MFKIGFKKHYKVLNFTTEIGKHTVGGVGTYMDQLYKYHSEDTGFVHIYDGNDTQTISTEDYPDKKDILAVSSGEIDQVMYLSYDIAVIHFYALSCLVSEDYIRGRKLVYVVHSVPTPEPYYINEPFGIHDDIKFSFQSVCNRADIIVCVSNAEKEKLSTIYPYLSHKIIVIYNGIDFEEEITNVRSEINKERNVFGFIGRLDYRKGLLECIRSIKNIDCEFRIACGNEDPQYLNILTNYIDGASLKDRVVFYGWCSGVRKKSFLKSLDALIIPSLYEPFGYVVLEAMKEKIPVIVSSNGGMAEIVGDYKYCFNPYLANDLERCILEFQNDSIEEIKEQRSRLLERSKLFNSQEMVENYNNVFLNI